jgi:hypothetical protein
MLICLGGYVNGELGTSVEGESHTVTTYTPLASVASDLLSILLAIMLIFASF